MPIHVMISMLNTMRVTGDTMFQDDSATAVWVRACGTCGETDLQTFCGSIEVAEDPSWRCNVCGSEHLRARRLHTGA